MKLDAVFEDASVAFDAALTESEEQIAAKFANVQYIHDGQNGATFTPFVSAEGVISWTNDRELENPPPVNIKGDKGDKGDRGAQGLQGIQGVQGIKGDTGAKGDKGDPGKDGQNGANGSDGVSATHRWSGTTLYITSASGTSSANLKGDKGDTGAPGANGKDGADGKTPVKGTDYFTAADKAEMVSAVISALPKYNGEVVSV